MKKSTMRRYQILSSFDRAKILAELGEDYKTLGEIHAAQTAAFAELSPSERSADLADVTAELDRHAGRPRQAKEKRVKVCYSIHPITAAAIDDDRRTGESKGQVIDRWARDPEGVPYNPRLSRSTEAPIHR
jgi:hypothetical protein